MATQLKIIKTNSFIPFIIEVPKIQMNNRKQKHKTKPTPTMYSR